MQREQSALCRNLGDGVLVAPAFSCQHFPPLQCVVSALISAKNKELRSCVEASYHPFQCHTALLYNIQLTEVGVECLLISCSNSTRYWGTSIYHNHNYPHMGTKVAGAEKRRFSPSLPFF